MKPARIYAYGGANASGGLDGQRCYHARPSAPFPGAVPDVREALPDPLALRVVPAQDPPRNDRTSYGIATIRVKENVMALHIGSLAPDFEQDSTEGKINFHQFLGDKWGVLFSHPADFTPVCTTELGRVAKLKGEFDKRNVKVIALSVDPVASHAGWAADIEETQGTKVNFPILADADRKVATLYDMIHPETNDTSTVRSVFVIDPKKKIRLMITYPASAGRNFDEILRVIDSLQLTDNHSVATPVDWKDGQDVVIVPSLKDPAIMKQKFPKGWKELKPYLRMTPQPNK
jgi:thioredoxin-dependent peroxiredoxin